MLVTDVTVKVPSEKDTKITVYEPSSACSTLLAVTRSHNPCPAPGRSDNSRKDEKPGAGSRYRPHHHGVMVFPIIPIYFPHRMWVDFAVAAAQPGEAREPKGDGGVPPAGAPVDMFTARKKILKDRGAEPDVFEESVAQVRCHGDSPLGAVADKVFGDR